MKRLVWCVLPLLLLANVLRAEPIPSSVLYAKPAMWDLSLSPSGELLTFQQFDQEEGFVLSAMTTAHRQATPILAMNGENQRLREYRWLDDQHIYVKLKDGSRETADVLTLKVTDAIVEATLQQQKVRAELVSSLLPDGSLYIAADHDNSRMLRLYRVKLAQLYEYKVDPASLVDDQLTDIVDFSYDAKQQRFFAIQADVSSKTLKIFTRLLNDSSWREVFSETIDQDSGMTLPAHIGADGSLFVLSNAGRDKVGLYKYNNQTKALGDLLFEHPNFDLTGAEFDEQDRLTSVSFVDDGRIAYRYFNDENSAHAAKLQALYPGKTVVEIDRAADGHVQLLNVSANDDPGMAVLYHPQQAQLFSLGDYYPELRSYQRYPTQVLDVESAPGVQLEAYLTRPAPAIDNKVLLVMPHGGPVAVRDYNTFNSEVQYFVSRGFSVLRVNFRGSSGFGKKFIESGVGQFGQQIEHDISAAVAKVRRQYAFAKSCAMGSSYGGYSAVMLTIQHPELYQCAIGAYGIYDLPLLFNASNYKAVEQIQKRAERTVGKNSEALVGVSPVYLSDKVKVPVLLIAGLSDMTAEPEHTKRLAYVLKAAGKPVETLYYAKTGHGPNNSFWEKHELRIRYDFIRKTLGLPSDVSLVTPGSKAAIALGRDYALYAAAYEDDTLVAPNPATVTHNLEQAIALGDDEASRDLAIELLKKHDEPSTARAIKVLKAAADQHKVISATHLGFLYRTGFDVPRDPELSATYYDIAYQYGHSATVMVRLAYAYCTGKGKSQQWDRCLELLDLPKYIKQPRASRKYIMSEASWNAMRSVIAEVMTDASLTPAQVADLSDILQRQYGTQPIAQDVQISNGISNSFAQLRATTDTTASIADRQTLFAKINFKSKQPDVPTAYTYDWQIIPEKGPMQRHSSGIVFGKSSETLSVTMELLSKSEPGIYRLTIYDFKGKQVVNHDFTVVR